MEIEYKWDFPGAASTQARDALLSHPLVASALKSSERIHMHGIYYDTPAGTLSARRIGLRLRGENDRFVCCMKCPAPQVEGAAKARREYEAAADDILEGVRKLMDVGAPKDVCDEVLEHGVVVSCETDFVREACQLQVEGSFAAELAFDAGCLRREGRETPLGELELEYKGGDASAYHAYAAELRDAFGLQEQPLSKLARALQV